MNTTTLLKAGSAVIALGAAVSVIASALSNLRLGLSALAVVLATGFASVLAYLRRSARIAATVNRARKQAEAELRRNVEELVNIANSSATAEDLRWIQHRHVKRENALQQADQSEPVALAVGPLTAPLASAATEPTGQAVNHLVGIGVPPGNLVSGLPVSPLLPGGFTSAVLVGPTAGVVIDEIAFTRGLWKSLGPDQDNYLLSQLTALLKSTSQRGLPVVVVRRPDTPEHLRFTRQAGTVVDDPAEIPSSVFARIP